ncbi:MAG: hypothetical protein FWD98_07930 [Defluviitaleaceae bacterium]|nr:hypothetical protein [Defluviitaleaceae bacterium]
MAAFELNAGRPCPEGVTPELDPSRLREESIIAHKIYDSCRHLQCSIIL